MLRGAYGVRQTHSVRQKKAFSKIYYLPKIDQEIVLKIVLKKLLVKKKMS